MNADNSSDAPDTQPALPVEVSSQQDAPVAPAEPTPPQEAAPEAASASAPETPREDEAEPPAPPEDLVTSRRRGNVAPAHIPLERIDADTTFQLRPEGELSGLATDLARLGQLFPVDVRFKPPDRFQVICGFRRVAALRFLKRDRVLARLHTDLSDEDALLLALAAALHGSPMSREDLEAQRARLESQGQLTPIARDMLDKALEREDALAPETVEEEVDADELAVEATQRLVDLNQDLALLADVFRDLEDTRKRELITQLRYSADLVAWLETL
jgi:ParB family chromosome partitioning protein